MATKKEALYVVNQFGRDHFIWAESAAEARAKATQPVPTQFVANLTAPGAATATAAFTGNAEVARTAKQAASR
ncbi:MAG TPA: hypothetical protein VIG44_12980 [Thermomicrobiales bacterium]